MAVSFLFLADLPALTWGSVLHPISATEDCGHTFLPSWTYLFLISGLALLSRFREWVGEAAPRVVAQSPQGVPPPVLLPHALLPACLPAMCPLPSGATGISRCGV